MRERKRFSKIQRTDEKGTLENATIPPNIFLLLRKKKKARPKKVDECFF